MVDIIPWIGNGISVQSTRGGIIEKRQNNVTFSSDFLLLLLQSLDTKRNPGKSEIRNQGSGYLTCLWNLGLCDRHSLIAIVLAQPICQEPGI